MYSLYHTIEWEGSGAMNIRLTDDPFLWRGLVVFASLVGTYLFFTYVFAYLSPFIVAYAASLAMEPLVGFFERRLGISRDLATLLGIVIFVFAIGYVGVALVNNVWREAVLFTAQIPELLAHGMQLLDGFIYGSEALGAVFDWAPDWLGSWSDGLVLSLAEFAQSTIGDGVAYTSITLFRTLPSFVMWVLLFVISAFFFVKDKHLIRAAVVRNSPRELRAWFSRLRLGMIVALAGYVKAQLFIMSIVGLISFGGLAIYGYQYALFMGLLIAVLDGLPFVGSSLILVPWAVLSLIQGDMYSGLYFLALWGINFLVRQLLEPKVLSASIGIHPILMLVSIYAGLRLIGPLGILVGPMWVMSMRITLSS